MHLLVTRPEPEAADLKARLEDLGLRATLAPMLELEILPAALSFDGVQALVVTSRNALRSLAQYSPPSEARTLPLFAVGAGTAKAAQSLGFSRVIAGTGGARDLLPLIAAATTPDKGAILYLAGEEVAVDLAPALEAKGFSVRRAVVYRMHPASRLTASVVDAIQTGDLDGVIVLSPRTAAIFASLVRASEVENAARRLKYYCMSEAVAEALAPLAPVEINIADEARLEEVLALLARLAPESS